jgi:hypothetical protein
MPYVQKYCLCYSFVPSSDLYHVPCTTYLVSCTTCPVPRTPYLAPRTSYLAPCISYLVPRTLYLLLSTLYLIRLGVQPHIDGFLDAMTMCPQTNSGEAAELVGRTRK